MKRKSIVALTALFLILMASTTAHAASKASLLLKIQRYTSGSILKSYYADYDFDGEKELFAVIGTESYNKLWFASSKQVVNLPIPYGIIYINSPSTKVVNIGKIQKLFIAESGAFGSSTQSNCFYVDRGRAIRVEKAGCRLTKVKGRQFTVAKDTFDGSTQGNLNTGHTYKNYYVKWTGSKFVEYKGRKISQAALKKYQGASSILKKAKKEGFTIGAILKRGNGIININLYKYYGTNGRKNDNLTLKISGNKVDLVPVSEGYDSSWISKYSYGGIYRVSGF